MTALNLKWQVSHTKGSYLIVCTLGDIQIVESIDRMHWNRAIDRCLVFRRAVGKLARAMHAVSSVLADE